MHILHVFPYSARLPGGHSNAIQEFMSCQKEVGLSVSALSPSTDEEFENARPLPEDTVEVPYSNLSEVLAAIDRQGGGKPMIVHLHAIDSFQTELARHVKGTGKRVVLTSHGQLNTRSGFHAFKKFLYLTFRETPVRHASGIHVLTARERQRLRFLIPFYQGAVTALPHVIRVPENPATLRTGTEPFTILHLGRLDIQTKGLDLLVEGFAQSGLKQARLILAGPDWNGGRATLESLALDLGCAARVFFPGPVYDEDKERMFAKADLFVAASRNDAFNIALVEALVRRVPALVSDRMNLAPELLHANAAEETTCTVGGIASKITNICNNPDRRQTLSDQGFKWAKSRCNSSVIGERFTAFYENILRPLDSLTKSKNIGLPSTPIKIIHIFPYSCRIPGGHSNAILGFINCQRAIGLEPMGISPLIPSHNNNSRPIPPGISEIEFTNSSALIAEISHLAGKSQFVVHLHTINQFTNTLALHLRRLGMSIALTSHGQLDNRNTFHLIQKLVYLSFFNSVVRSAGGIQFLTHTEHRSATRYLPLGKQSIKRVIPHPIAKPTARPADKPTRERPFTVLFLGRIDIKHKGLDVILKGFAKSDLEQARLIFAGPDWNGGIAKLTKLAETLGCGDRVFFLGEIYGPEKEAAWASADLFIVMSRWEAFNISLAEAIRHEIPCLISRNVNLAPELAQASAAEVIKLSSRSVAKAISNLSKNPIRRQKLSSAGSLWIENQCDEDVVGRKFIEFYTGILSSTSANSH